MNLTRWFAIALLIAAPARAAMPWTDQAVMAGLPSIPTRTVEQLMPVTLTCEAEAPLAELDIQSLRSWMSHSLRPVLLDDGDIDPGEWPMLEFRPFFKDLELELQLDLPALLDRRE